MALPNQETPLLDNVTRSSWGLGRSVLVGIVVVTSILVVSYLEIRSSDTADLRPADVLVAPSGYMLRPAPELESEARAQVQGDPNLQQIIQELAARDVVDANTRALSGTISVMAWDPATASEPGLEMRYTRKIEDNLGIDATRVTLEGQSIFELVAPASAGGYYLLAWQYENLFVTVGGLDRETAYAIASTVMRAGFAAT